MSTAARGGTFIRFWAGTVGASARHVGYITRDRAVLEEEHGIMLYNLPERIAAGRDYAELRDNLVAHASVREKLEIDRHQSRGEPRTHYRVLVSFERNVTSEKALGMVREWLDREFPKARGFAAVHRDTEQTHVHVWLDARQVDGRKVHLDRQRHRSLDSTWNHIYSREMGRDPREHELKKEQTREAKRRGWEQRQKPEYPPRTRKAAAELAPRWERREIGVQASRPGGERAGGSFLEHVRTVAGRDLREARTWDDLARRLERHGFRVEAKGAGMVLTDGREHVKASSVDRDASRAKLERRFGVTLAEHQAHRSVVDSLSPRVREVVQDLHALDQANWLRADHGRAARDLAELRARRDQLQWQAERVVAASRALDRALAEVYRAPAEARRAYDELARARGADHAVRELRERPERFGALKTVEQRRHWGLVRSEDAAPARERARGAAELGRALAEARAAAPHRPALAHLDAAVRRAGARVNAVGAQVKRNSDGTRERVRIGLAMNKLLPREINDLHRWITAPHRQVTIELQRTVARMAPHHVRELAQWLAAPHRQLPARAIQALKGLMQDRELDRGR
ncbi:MAG TPA: relaxase/mobilization nuclease domain-containing protein [Longimicrobiaceae bacterium]|nr:relaxase/mobilization nuclease domain-containing protein [Longimicrobiaceae bacterium]